MGKFPNVVNAPNLLPDGVLYESYPLLAGSASSGSHSPASARMSAVVMPVPLRGGVPISGAKCVSGIASVTPTHSWAAIIRVSDRTVLAKSTNDPSVWNANSARTFPFPGNYVPISDEFVWVALLQNAATPASYRGLGSSQNLLNKFTPPAAIWPIESTLTDPASLGSPIAAGYGGINEVFYVALLA
jgi:hypothetical protein